MDVDVGEVLEGERERERLRLREGDREVARGEEVESGAGGGAGAEGRGDEDIRDNGVMVGTRELRQRRAAGRVEERSERGSSDVVHATVMFERGRRWGRKGVGNEKIEGQGAFENDSKRSNEQSKGKVKISQ